MFLIFAKKLFLFIMINFIILIGINYFYTERMLSQTSLKRIDDQFNRLKDQEEIKIIVLGDSRPNVAVNTEIMPNSFNFAYSLENYMQTYYKLKNVIERRKVIPNLLLVQMDYYSFCFFFENQFFNEWYWREFIDFKELENISGQGRLLRNVIVGYFPAIDNGGTLIQYLRKGPELSYLGRGWLKRTENYSLTTDKSLTAKKLVEQQFRDREPIDNTLIVYFQKILDLAKSYNIQVALIKYPITKEYQDALASRYNIEIFNKTAENIYRDYKNITILDYHTFYQDTPELFSDVNHLNEEGAKILTNQIMKDLNIVGDFSSPVNISFVSN